MKRYDMASILKRARSAKKEPLTDAEIQKLKVLNQEYESLQKKLADAKAQYDAEMQAAEKREAEKVVERWVEEYRTKASSETPTQTQARIEKIRAKREDYYKQLAAMGYKVNSDINPKQESSPPP